MTRIYFKNPISILLPLGAAALGGIGAGEGGFLESAGLSGISTTQGVLGGLALGSTIGSLTGDPTAGIKQAGQDNAKQSEFLGSLRNASDQQLELLSKSTAGDAFKSNAIGEEQRRRSGEKNRQDQLSTDKAQSDKLAQDQRDRNDAILRGVNTASTRRDQAIADLRNQINPEALRTLRERETRDEATAGIAAFRRQFQEADKQRQAGLVKRGLGVSSRSINDSLRANQLAGESEANIVAKARSAADARTAVDVNALNTGVGRIQSAFNQDLNNAKLGINSNNVTDAFRLANNRFNISSLDNERKFQEGLSRASTRDQRTAELAKFQANQSASQAQFKTDQDRFKFNTLVASQGLNEFNKSQGITGDLGAVSTKTPTPTI